MTRWELSTRPPFAVNEGRDRTSAVDYGWRFQAADGAGNEITIRVMQARGSKGRLTTAQARAAVRPYLDDPTPPAQLILDLEGRFRPVR